MLVVWYTCYKELLIDKLNIFDYNLCYTSCLYPTKDLLFMICLTFKVCCKALMKRMLRSGKGHFIKFPITLSVELVKMNMT